MRELGLSLYRSVSTEARRSAPLSIPRLSWPAVFVVTAAVAGLTWGLMQQRLPDIDPRQVIAINLAAAQLAMEDERYLDPPQHSALHYYTTVLALDSTNTHALHGIDTIAAQYIKMAKQAILEDRFANAVIAIDAVRRVQPTHPRLALLERELHRGLEHRVSVLKQELSRPRLPAAPTTAQREQVHPEKNSVVESVETSSTAQSKGRDEPVRGRTEPGAAGSSAPELSALIASFERTKAQLAMASTASVTPAASQSGAGGAAPSIEPKVVRWVQPIYPQAARVRGIEGWVDLILLVSPSGDVVDTQVQHRSGSRLFERAARTAVKQWKYEPRAAGNTVENRIPVRVEFRLEDG